MPLTGAYYPKAACCNTDLALLLCHRQQSEQQAIIRSPQSVRKIGLRIPALHGAHARAALIADDKYDPRNRLQQRCLAALVTVLAPCTTTYPSLSRSTTPAAKSVAGVWPIATNTALVSSVLSSPVTTLRTAMLLTLAGATAGRLIVKPGMAIGAPVFCVGEEVPVMEVTTVLVSRVMVGLALARSTMICEARKLSRR